MNFFFQFHLSILGWLGIELYNLLFFQFFSMWLFRSNALGHGSCRFIGLS
jgi:hypothetical protein